METHLNKLSRLNPLAEAVADLAVWHKQAHRKTTTLVDKGVVPVLEFNGLAPSLKIKVLHDKTAFKTAGSDRCRNLRAQVPAVGVDQVAIPGDRGHAKVKMAHETGKVQIEDMLMDELTRLSLSAKAVKQ